MMMKENVVPAKMFQIDVQMLIIEIHFHNKLKVLVTKKWRVIYEDLVRVFPKNIKKLLTQTKNSIFI